MISNKHASVQSLPTLGNFLLVLVLGCPLVLQLGCVITCDGSTSLPGGGGERQIPHTSKQLEPHFYKHCINLSVFQTIPDLYSSATLFKHKGACWTFFPSISGLHFLSWMLNCWISEIWRQNYTNDWYKIDVFNVPSLTFSKTKNSVPPTREKDKGNNRVWFTNGVNEISR